MSTTHQPRGSAAFGFVIILGALMLLDFGATSAGLTPWFGMLTLILVGGLALLLVVLVLRGIANARHFVAPMRSDVVAEEHLPAAVRQAFSRAQQALREAGGAIEGYSTIELTRHPGGARLREFAVIGMTPPRDLILAWRITATSTDGEATWIPAPGSGHWTALLPVAGDVAPALFATTTHEAPWIVNPNRPTAILPPQATPTEIAHFLRLWAEARGVTPQPPPQGIEAILTFSNTMLWEELKDLAGRGLVAWDQGRGIATMPIGPFLRTVATNMLAPLKRQERARRQEDYRVLIETVWGAGAPRG